MNDRVKAYRERQKAAGLSQVTLWLDGPTAALLKQATAIQQRQPGEIIAAALHTWWAHQAQTTPNPTAATERMPPLPDTATDPALLREWVRQLVQEELATATSGVSAADDPSPPESQASALPEPRQPDASQHSAQEQEPQNEPGEAQNGASDPVQNGEPDSVQSDDPDPVQNGELDPVQNGEPDPTQNDEADPTQGGEVGNPRYYEQAFPHGDKSNPENTIKTNQEAHEEADKAQNCVLSPVQHHEADVVGQAVAAEREAATAPTEVPEPHDALPHPSLYRWPMTF
ncbi:MAG: hypothetical protein HQL88_07480 [Magnetococcales bacterium]|nr:hypothetical protein [Magnetococcales bacterium]